MSTAGRRGARLSATAVALGSLVAAASGTTAAATAHPVARPAGTASGLVDVRASNGSQTQAALDTRAARVSARPAVSALRASLGQQAVVDIDPTTLTPREVARLDGFLTGPSTAPAAGIALAYVRAHPGVFRLSGADLAGLRLARDYLDISGTSHLSWVQAVGGVPLFGNGLKANVARDGRLINVLGSPVSGLRAPAAPAKLGAGAAIRRAKTAMGASHAAAATGDTVKPVLFATSGGTRAAYQVVAMSVASPALSVVDAVTGRVLFRESLTADASAGTGTGATPATTPAAVTPAAADESASVFANYPGAPSGGTQKTVDLTARGWLPAGSVVLFGNNAHTYTDVNDNNAPDPSEEVSPNARGSYGFTLKRFLINGEPCRVDVCSWQPTQPYSWTVNRSQTSTQNFYFINEYHDHLAAAPIGFTGAAGNFQQVNRTGKGLGGDPVQDEPLDGADTAAGLPDANHIDNANFATPPDGQAPRMQMYLWHTPGASYPGQDPFIGASGSDESDIVYHEYTHGLTHRLVVDSGGVPSLDSVQGGSMGEAWSDWYALDYLVDQGLLKDTAKPGEVEVGRYVLPSFNFRTEPTDCTVGAPASVCPGTAAAGSGGYTYGDFGKISGSGPEVHADGEIWAQTLWDLRTAVGSTMAESLVTRGLELSPTFPSFLDMRNAIIAGDLADHGGAHVKLLWKIFAHRGMGFFAGTITGNDVSPVENFSLPPAAGTPTTKVTGRVVNSTSRQGVAGAVVAFGGHDSGFPGSYTAVTGAHGYYTIAGVLPGTYPDVYSGGAGYNSAVRTVRVAGHFTALGFSLVRDWAAASGGASVAASNGDENASFDCGAAALIDQSLGNGWSTAKPASGGRFATVRLPAAVNISTLQIDPSGTCGDTVVASAGKYTVSTSKDGTTFRTAAAGTFTPADIGHLVTVPLAAGTGTAVKYIRYTIYSNQASQLGVTCTGGAGDDEGCPWFDSQEMEVFGLRS